MKPRVNLHLKGGTREPLDERSRHFENKKMGWIDKCPTRASVSRFVHDSFSFILVREWSQDPWQVDPQQTGTRSFLWFFWRRKFLLYWICIFFFLSWRSKLFLMILFAWQRKKRQLKNDFGITVLNSLTFDPFSASMSWAQLIFHTKFSNQTSSSINIPH